MKQEEYLAAIKKQQSLIRKLFASQKRRSQIINELTKEHYGHLVGKFFKADGERFKRYKGVTFYIAVVHGGTKAGDSDAVVISLECRYLMRSAIYPGITFKGGSDHDNIAFFTQIFNFTLDDDMEGILAPLYISQERFIEDFNAMNEAFIKTFLKKR